MKKYLGPNNLTGVVSRFNQKVSAKEENMDVVTKEDTKGIWDEINKENNEIQTDEWQAILDKNNGTITLLHYIGSDTNVVVKNEYEVEDKVYKTKLGNTQYDEQGKMSTALFHKCNNVISIEFEEGIDYSELTDVSYMFNMCTKVESIIFPEDFDTSRVISMRCMFYYCSKLSLTKLHMFDTSSVTNMRDMFCYCKVLISVDLSNFDTLLVTDMHSMFQACSLLTELDLRNFDTNENTDIDWMFADGTALVKVIVSRSKWKAVDGSNTWYSYTGTLTSKYSYV